MASSVSLYTGLSGLNANARRIDAIGNNIANANTTGFKSSRLMFSNMLSRNMDFGSAPADMRGGTNPHQIGLGVKVSGTQRDFREGPLATTGDPRDLAIEGGGLFIVQRGEDQFYTRAGNFRLDASRDLTTIEGDRVMGFGVDDEFNIQPGVLQPINIPLQELTVAEATQNLRFAGNLNASGEVAQRGSLIRLGPDEGVGFNALGDPNGLGPGSLLTTLEDPDAPGEGMFQAGQTLSVQGARKGGSQLPPSEFAVQENSTIQNLLDFLTGALRIQGSDEPNPDGANPGVAFDAQTGQFVVNGNTGEINDLRLRPGDIRLRNGQNGPGRPLFEPEKVESADGESVRTQAVIYDSLGTPLEVDVAMVLVGKNDGGTMWQYYIESDDSTGAEAALGQGEIEFDNNGRLTTQGPVQVQLPRDGTGAETPLVFDMFFDSETDGITALADRGSNLSATYRDGAPIGTLENYSVKPDGTIMGVFSNTLTRPLGQLPLATFPNPEGLTDVGSNLFRGAANSGDRVVRVPGEGAAGRVLSGALEESNVDLGQEFIELIMASTGYSASSRVIRTTDELMQQLLVLGR